MSTRDDGLEPREELAALTAALRARLARHARAGAWAVSAAPSPRPELDAASGDPGDAHDDAGAVAGPVEPAAEDAAVPRVRLTLAEIRAELGDCRRCRLAEGRQHLVFGAGAEDAPLMFVGEGPGADEDRTGEPFVGRAGELLDKMIEAMGWSRDTVYIANVVKCRPPGNRTPELDEVACCEPFLRRQIEAVAPRVLVALGRPAANTLLATDAPISALRGRFHAYRGGPRVMPTFHPAYLLRQPERKRDAWADLKLVMAELARLGVASPRPPKG